MPARYIMIGGFLGAGKTTAMLRLGRHLVHQSLRVGLVTNDQSSGLVDTRLLESQGFEVEEITGGCFCCRFGSLMEAASRLADRTAPDVFLAEPVGSCTDLKATVAYPLRRMYGEHYRIAPFSVLVDPVRALRVLGLESGRAFSSKVQYIYEKQLEEADVLVINKIDGLEAERRETLRRALTERFPGARLFEVSALNGEGLEPWFAHLTAGEDCGTANTPIEYDTYAEGEARLGWLNMTVRLTAPAFDGNHWLEALAGDLQRRLQARGIEIAHLKMTLSPSDGADVAVVNAVTTSVPPSRTFSLQGPITEAELVINLRGEGDPAHLRDETMTALSQAAAAVSAVCEVVHAEHFQPSRPVPTHRMVMTP